MHHRKRYSAQQLVKAADILMRADDHVFNNLDYSSSDAQACGFLLSAAAHLYQLASHQASLEKMETRVRKNKATRFSFALFIPVLKGWSDGAETDGQIV